MSSAADEIHRPSPSLKDPNSNPLYVHHADHAGIALVSEKLAGLGNFNTWRRSVLMALGARNKAVFVDGTFTEVDMSHPDYASWSRCNNIVCTWIVNAVEKLIAKSIMYLTTARQMWWTFMISSNRVMDQGQQRLRSKSLRRRKVLRVSVITIRS